MFHFLCANSFLLRHWVDNILWHCRHSWSLSIRIVSLSWMSHRMGHMYLYFSRQMLRSSVLFTYLRQKFRSFFFYIFKKIFSEIHSFCFLLSFVFYYISVLPYFVSIFFFLSFFGPGFYISFFLISFIVFSYLLFIYKKKFKTFFFLSFCLSVCLSFPLFPLLMQDFLLRFSHFLFFFLSVFFVIFFLHSLFFLRLLRFLSFFLFVCLSFPLFSFFIQYLLLRFPFFFILFWVFHFFLSNFLSFLFLVSCSF